MSPTPDRRLLAVLDPRQIVRWMYVSRVSLAWAILIAAIAAWKASDTDKTLVVTITFVVAHIMTIASFAWSDVRRRPLTRGFFYLQSIFDLLFVTAVVHVTDGQFAALYILVNAAAAIVLPFGGAILSAALGLVLYLADVLLVQGTFATTSLTLQLVVFALVAVGSSVIAGQLRAAGTGREALAAELKRVQLREADILRNIRSGIITVGEAGELLFANAMAAELLDRDLGPGVGRPILDEIERTAPGLVIALRRSMRDHEPLTRSEGVLFRAEAPVPLGVTTTTVADDAGGCIFTAIFQDISDQKRLEQLNLRAQRLEAVAELSASLAHEIKNPLASIQSAVEQMAARPAASDDERTLGTLIVRESDRLSRLLSEFLDFARVRATRRDALDLCAVVRGAVRLAESHPGRAAGARVDVAVPADALVLRGDEDLLHRAVFNLVLNALQATRPGTTVRVSAATASAARVPHGVASLDHGAVVIDVADEGPGIDPAVQGRLFEPFTTTKVGGTGLGLAITHRAIEAHRGVVLVDTNERGTRFSVFLPTGDDPGSTA
jgi:two-component system sensor histidine kinase PilS (NtrC family)